MSNNEIPDTEGVNGSEPSRPRRSDGRFMAKPDIERLKKEKKNAYAMLEQNNQALMKGTPFDKDTFKGMNPRQINQFLINHHAKLEKERAKVEKGSKDGVIPSRDSNMPILGTPVGPGNARYFIDQYLKIDPKANTIEFEAPASMVLGKHKNKEEAKEKWLDRR